MEEGANDLEGGMAAGAGLSPTFTMLDGAYRSKENVSSINSEDPGTLEGLKEMKVGKPPRQLPVIRHCVSTTWLSPDLVCFTNGCMPFRIMVIMLTSKS